MKIFGALALAVYTLVISPQILAMSCETTVGTSALEGKALRDAVHSLGEAWRTADWQGAHPYRFYNVKALERVVGDHDLAKVAKKWGKLNVSKELPDLSLENRRNFLNYSYQYLVALGDLRVKHDMPPGGVSDQPKPMLNYLKLILKRFKRGEDVSRDIEILDEFLFNFVHIAKGVEGSDSEIRKFLVENITPRLEKMVLNEAVHSLGEAWRTADWQSAHRSRYYNVRALERVVGDHDLAKIAKKWGELNASTEFPGLLLQDRRDFLTYSYQYLVALGDFRIKYNIPAGGVSGQPKPMLTYLKLILKRFKRREDISRDIEILDEFLFYFVDAEKGVKGAESEIRQFLVQHMTPRLVFLQMQ